MGHSCPVRLFLPSPQPTNQSGPNFEGWISSIRDLGILTLFQNTPPFLVTSVTDFNVLLFKKSIFSFVFLIAH